MKGYKAMYNGSCIGQEYEVGKTYKMITNINPKDKKPFPIKMNILGFHYCVDPNEVVYYKDIKRIDFELYEIEDMNPNNLSSCVRSVTDEIKIVRKIPRNEYRIIFTKNYFELVGISRVYVWNTPECDFKRMIKKILVEEK